MDKLDGMRTFVAVAEAGSFTASAERLSISKKLASKYVGQLEEELDVRLLYRTTRRLSLTSEGQSYYDNVTRILDEIDELESNLKYETVALAGTLRISAPSTFGEVYIQPLLRKFGQIHPNITFDLRLSDEYVGITEGGFDLAIRIGELENSSLIARKLAMTALWVVVSQDYVDRHGVPKTPDELVLHNCIRDTNIRGADIWVFSGQGQSKTVAVSGRFKVNSARSARDLALAGEGIALCPDYIVTRDIKEGALRRILCGTDSGHKPVQAVFPSAKYIPTRVRSLIDFLSIELPHTSD